ncbi:hypothetical protein AB0D12_41070 [Streptomyces sp. NPDC048479]|uniref:hypothetical protein n=1 Tax=Streptomyces sp. NPDC048479 TaxID=3154725 RepID=UPI00342D3C33
MTRKRRKTLVVCTVCHDAIHSDSHPIASRNRSLESPLRGNSYSGFGGGRAENDLLGAGASPRCVPNQRSRALPRHRDRARQDRHLLRGGGLPHIIPATG